MAEFKTKELYVKFDGSSVDAAYGDTVLKVDVKKVTGALTSAVGVIGLENCLKLGAGAAIVATSLYAVTKLASRYFPGLKVNEVKEGNCLEVSVPEKHVARFDNMVAGGRLTKMLQIDFEELETTLITLLGDDQYEKVGKGVLKLIENVRIDSINSQKASNPNATGKIFEGENKDTITNHKTVVAAGKNTKVVGEYFKGSVQRNITRGEDYVLAGFESKEVQEIQGDRIKLTIRGEKLSEKFEHEFKPKDNIEDVIRELKKKEGKTFRIFRDGKQLDEDTTIAQITTLRALTESEIPKTANPMEH